VGGLEQLTVSPGLQVVGQLGVRHGDRRRGDTIAVQCEEAATGVGACGRAGGDVPGSHFAVEVVVARAAVDVELLVTPGQGHARALLVHVALHRLDAQRVPVPAHSRVAGAENVQVAARGYGPHALAG